MIKIVTLAFSIERFEHTSVFTRNRT